MKSKASVKKKKLSEYNGWVGNEMRGNEKDRTLPKLYTLNSWNQRTKWNEETGEEIDEMKC